jgi:hypothetical protein
MSISSGAVTTGTPLAASKANQPSCICVTSCGRGTGALNAADFAAGGLMLA